MPLQDLCATPLLQRQCNAKTFPNPIPWHPLRNDIAHDPRFELRPLSGDPLLGLEAKLALRHSPTKKAGPTSAWNRENPEK